MLRPVRVRFAPSPTGFFHVGGARTALFNWLFARHHGGAMVLRIEDTDLQRNREEWVDGIVDALSWLGLDWDEGPIHQSQRAKLYAEAAEQLYASGRAYYCECTREAVEERTRHISTPGYDGYCRDRGLEPGPGRALRFRTPQEGSTTVVDVIRGSPSFENRTIEDFVILRSDATPIFILASVVDDIDMAITHVIRGEEHLPNTPKTLLLWEALGGGDPPAFAHVPVLVNERRQKLSKRRDKVAVEDYRAQGFLAEALRNYLALLGWAPAGGREVLTIEEMVQEFRLEDVTPSPAFFDERKLLHLNAEYLRRLSASEFVAAVARFLEQPFTTVAPLVQERVRTLSEVPGMVEFLFLPEPHIDPRAWDKRVVRGPHAAEILSDALNRYSSCDWTAAVLHDVTAAIGEVHGLNLAKAQFPVRVAVTGRDVGPPLFESLEVLGRQRTLERLGHAIERLAA